MAAGAGAGIPATFNTPIGGVMFATELLMPEVSVNTFLPVALATGSATFVGWLFFGSQPAFAVPAALSALPNEPGSALTLLLYAVLGAIVGAAAALFVRSLGWAEDLFERIPGTTFAAFLRMSENAGGLRHVVVTRRNRVFGVLRVNVDLRRAVGAAGAEVTLGELVHRHFTVVREDAAVFDVITRMRRKDATMALVIPRAGYEKPTGSSVSLRKNISPNSIASSIGLYPR